MGKVNVCLKRSYFVAISLIAIIAILLLGLTLFSHGHFHKEEEIEEVLATLHVMYAISVIILVLTFIGGFGAYKEKKWALIVFTVGMIMSTLFMMACNIGGMAARPQLAKDMRRTYMAMLPLTNHSESDSLMEVQAEKHKRNILAKVHMGVFEKFFSCTNQMRPGKQVTLQCCGLEQGYQDWHYYIPESCLCAEDSTNPCVAAPRNSSLFENRKDEEPIMIYALPCLPYVVDSVMSGLNALLGILLGVTLLWVLAVALCIVILCRLDRKEEIPTVVYSQQAKAGNYTTLSEEYT